MSVRQPYPTGSITLTAGTSTVALRQPGSRISLVSLSGAFTMQVAIDGGSFMTIAPGFPVNLGLEEFSTVQFKNNNSGSITFEAELGWAERPDSRTNILSTVQIQGATSTQVTAMVTTQVDTLTASQLVTSSVSVPSGAGKCVDIAGTSDTKEVLISNSDSATTILARDALASTQVGTMIGPGQTASLQTTADIRLVNTATGAVTAYVNRIKT